MAANHYLSITHCRLSQAEGCGPHGEQWITDLENLIRMWTVDPVSAHKRIMQGTRKQHRLAQIVGDLLSVVREAEGEKAVLANAILKGKKRHLKVGRSRTFRFVVDGRLEHLVSLPVCQR